MDKVVITQFSDPMMGLSWECEPALQKAVAYYGGGVELRDSMGVLVRDVADFMTPAELALPENEGIEAYNARLAQIYLDEVPIGGVPMNMEGFCLFASDRRSSLPLCLAYEAAKLACPEKARVFLMRLREATVSECRPTTKVEEIVRVARICGIDDSAFMECYWSGKAAAALEADMLRMHQLGIRAMPAFLVESATGAVLVCGVADATMLIRAVETVCRKAEQ